MTIPTKLKVKTRNRERSIKKLLQAGTEIFSKYGYDGATTKMIAKRAGMNEGLINHYFKGKPGLLLAIILEFIKRKIEQADTSPVCETVEEEIRTYLQMRIKTHLEELDFFRIAVARAAIDPKISVEIQKHIPLFSNPVLLKRLQALQERGKIREGLDLEVLAINIQTQSMGFLFMIQTFRNIDCTPLNEAIQQFAKLIAQAVVE